MKVSAAVRCWAFTAAKSICAFLWVVGSLVATEFHAQAAPFQNLDFEQAEIVPLPGEHGAIEPLLALPYWTVSSCMASGCVQTGYVLHNTSWVDAGFVELRSDYAVQGVYSVQLQSVHFFGVDVDLRLSQAGTIPEDARSINFLVGSSGLSGLLLLNNTPIPLYRGGNRLWGDVSQFAGEVVVLALQGSGYFDDIQFSSVEVPDRLQLSYVSQNGKAAITGHTGLGKSVIIPETINGVPVVSIAARAFTGCTMSSIMIPRSVRTIGAEAFSFCPNLTSIEIPESVADLPEKALKYCTALTNVVLPNSITNIGPGAFASCTSLQQLEMPENLRNIGEGAFVFCSSLRNVALPEGLRSVGSYAFEECTLLTNVTIPSSVTRLGGEYTFSNCTNLASVTLPEGMSKIGYGMFSGCQRLVSVRIPESVGSLEVSAFSGCGHLTNLVVPNSVTNLGRNAFAFCKGMEGLYFEGNAPRVGDGVLADTPSCIVYYLPGTAGWGATFAGRPTAPWVRPEPVILKGSVGLDSAGLKFTVSWATNAPLVVEATGDLAQPAWLPLSTNTISDGPLSFTDSRWAEQSTRFYRVRSF